MSQNTPEPNLPVAEAATSAQLRAVMKKVCKAGGDLGCSCADGNFQWFGYSCQMIMMQAMKDACSDRATPIPDTSAGEREAANSLAAPVDEDGPSEFWAGKASAAFVLAEEIKLRKTLVSALSALLDAVKNEPAMRGRQYVHLGIQVNNALSEANRRPSAWDCAARKQSLPEPTDCNWPTCGCDPNADKVISALEEQGFGSPAPDPPSSAGERMREALVPIYVKKWRTLIMVPPTIRDEINADLADELRASLTSQSSKVDSVKAFEKAWASRPWIDGVESDKDKALRWWNAAHAALALQGPSGKTGGEG